MEHRHLICFQPGRDDAALARGLASAGWIAHFTSEIEPAKDLIHKHQIHVGLARIDDTSAYPLFMRLREEYSASGHMEWVALLPAASLDCQDVCRRIKDNFFDFHTLPVDKTRLVSTLGHAWGMASLGRRLLSGANEVHQLGEMVGNSAAMRNIFQTIRKYAGVNAPVLITGESGTGKELAAKAIHERSARAMGPFVAVNCAALPHTLIHSELFGHEKGAFTGAHECKIGRLESAAGGTIFLDEIGDLPMDLQVNLLRFLQEKTIERVGGKKSIDVDVRVISATNVDLEQAVADSRFREDLYYRLNVLNLEMPALRHREEDIELLAHYFFTLFSDERNCVKGFSQTALRAIRAHEWPGNVRELINSVRRAVVMCDHRLISPKDLGLDIQRTERKIMTLEEVRNTAEREALCTALRTQGNNISQASRQLNVSRVTFYRLMEKHKISV